MPSPTTDPPALVAHFFRHEYGRTVAALVRTFGPGRLETIEDCVQGAMAQALEIWGRHGLPDRPGAWIHRAAQRRILDRLRHHDVIRRAEPGLAMDEEPSPPAAYLPGEVEDATLRMLFICCHDGLNRPTQLVLALKILCGFSVREIALRLVLNPEAVRKRIARGRRKLRELAPDLDSPSVASLRARLAPVHQVIYLLFNEGYSSAHADTPIRRELCVEAIRLGALLANHPAGDTPSTWALLALMHFHHARIEARTDAYGALLLMEAQDRGLWDPSGLQVGLSCLARSASGDAFTRYHAEAAILAEHCRAPSFDETDWAAIVRLYQLYEHIHPSPIHTLNRAIAIAEWKGAAAGLAVLLDMTPPAWLVRYYLWDATLGELYRRTGAWDRARAHLTKAREGAPTDAERAHLTGRIEACGPNP